MAESAGEKKHDATPYRRQKAREQGQVARSQDLGSALILVCAVALLWSYGPAVLTALKEAMTACITQARYQDMSSGAAYALIAMCVRHCLWGLLPILLGVCAIALLNSWFQVGILFLPEKLGWDFKRISPLAGTKRLFDLPNFARLGFGLLKIALVSAVIASGLWGQWDAILGAHTLGAGDIGELVWNTTLDMCMRAAIVLLLLAIFDYGFQWWKTEQDLKMTDEEVREEMKMMNGDPQIAARRRQVQRQLAMVRVQNAVPDADVIITNPTELAIAIKFDPEKMPAPMVLAKGAGHVAARIRKFALESGIPVVERKPLAQALFKHVEVGQIVPVEHYAAVAEVLRFVYQLQGKKLPTLEKTSDK